MQTSPLSSLRAVRICGAACALLLAHVISAQTVNLHVNPIIDKLAKGGVVVGVSTGDLSLDNAHALSRADVDFVRLEMEHGPLDIDKMYAFLNAMVDRAAILKQGNPQLKV